MPVSPSQLRTLVDAFDWDTYLARIRAAVTRDYEGVALDQAAHEATAHDLDFNPDDPFITRAFTGYVGERITQLDRTTRDTLVDELRSALAAGTGESMTALAGRLATAVDDSAALSAARALTIARTETAIAYNHGALLAYGQNGIDRVEVSDGDGDEECADADGQIWTIDEAMANPVAHPNCVRSFAPVVETEE